MFMLISWNDFPTFYDAGTWGVFDGALILTSANPEFDGLVWNGMINQNGKQLILSDEYGFTITLTAK